MTAASVTNVAPGPGEARVPYESGAVHSPRMRRWIAGGMGPNRSLNYQLQTLRNRSRQGERNNPWLWKAIDSLVTNEVGIGVTLRSAAAPEDFRTTATELWKRVRDELDPARQLNFGGIQEQAVRGRRLAGQVFIRRLWRSLNAPLAVPFQLQVLEAEHCPLHYDADLPGGNRVRAGKEFDPRGLLVAFWFHPNHPQDYRFGTATDLGRLIRVPAVDVIQHYSPLRPGQDHGEPTLVRSLLAADTLDKYLDAELRRKETRAPYTGAIEREWSDQDAATSPATGAPLDADGGASVEAGTMLELNMGEKVHLFDADTGVQGIWDYARGVLLQVAAGAGGVPYELMTGDWEKVNDRLVRAMLNEFHRSIEMAQDHLLIFQVCARVWSWYIDAAVLAGKLAAPGYADDKTPWRAVNCRPHGWPFVHGLQDAEMKASLIASGLSSRQEERDKMPGVPIEDVDRQRREDMLREQELELPAANPGRIDPGIDTTNGAR